MISILTGDIVDSQNLRQKDREQLGSYLAEAAANADPSALIEAFAGDSWQCYCQAPQSAVRIALLLRAHLLGKRGIDTRVSIGIGSYESLKPEKISLSQGEAFVLSGRGLAEMPAERRLGIRTSATIPRPAPDLLSACVALLDGLSSQWTAKQAQAVALAGNERHQYQLAKSFDPPISAQAFGKHLAKAHWKLIRESLSSIETSLHPLTTP